MSCVCASCGHVLAVSALLFLIPALVLARRSVLLATLSLVLVCTSVWYHTSHDAVARMVDCSTVRVVAIAALIHVAIRGCRNPWMAFGGLAAVLGIHLGRGFHVSWRDGVAPWASHGPLKVHWHAAMHVCGVAALMAI